MLFLEQVPLEKLNHQVVVFMLTHQMKWVNIDKKNPNWLLSRWSCSVDTVTSVIKIINHVTLSKYYHCSFYTTVKVKKGLEWKYFSAMSIVAIPFSGFLLYFPTFSNFMFFIIPGYHFYNTLHGAPFHFFIFIGFWVFLLVRTSVVLW